MDNLIQQLRDRKIAVTPQRLAVMAALRSRRDHPSADHIFNTVYKTLEVLCQQGLVIKVNPLHAVARYDGVTGQHAHLICRQCHHIIDLDWEAADVPSLPVAERHGFQVEHPSLTFWGLCPRCRAGESPQED
jgi:Fe2+ or Zn2+ uptake regulation protein